MGTVSAAVAIVPQHAELKAMSDIPVASTDPMPLPGGEMMELDDGHPVGPVTAGLVEESVRWFGGKWCVYERRAERSRTTRSSWPEDTLRTALRYRTASSHSVILGVLRGDFFLVISAIIAFGM